MTREECESKILKEMKKIAKIYREYNPDGDYLSLAMFMNDGTFMGSNRYYDESSVDSERRVDFFESKRG